VPRSLILCACLTALLLGAPHAGAGETNDGNAKAARAVTVLRASVIGAGGSAGTSDHFRSQRTLGQPTPIGVGTSADFSLTSGFWRKLSIATGVLDGVLPTPFRNTLFPNTPNPFNPVTTIRFEVAKTAPVEIDVFDIRGRLVRSLVRETKAPGAHEVTWNGRDDGGNAVSSGVYLYRLRIGAFADVRKMVLVK
jgi:hypothetical protein